MFALIITIIFALALAIGVTRYLLTWDAELQERIEQHDEHGQRGYRVEQAVVRAGIIIVALITALLICGIIDLFIHP